MAASDSWNSLQTDVRRTMGSIASLAYMLNAISCPVVSEPRVMSRAP